MRVGSRRPPSCPGPPPPSLLAPSLTPAQAALLPLFLLSKTNVHKTIYKICTNLRCCFLFSSQELIFTFYMYYLPLPPPPPPSPRNHAVFIDRVAASSCKNASRYLSFTIWFVNPQRTQNPVFKQFTCRIHLITGSMRSLAKFPQRRVSRLLHDGLFDTRPAALIKLKMSNLDTFGLKLLCRVSICM